MKRVQQSGAQKRKIAKEKEKYDLMSTSNTKKLTSYFISNQTQHQTMESAEAENNNLSIQLDPDLNHNSESDIDMLAY